jgi:hypothetical protein
MSNSQEEDVSGSGSELELEDVPNEQSLAFGDMLDTVLSRHLEYTQDDNTLSLAEILLLIKQSLDSQNSILSELLRLKMAKYGTSSTTSGHSRQPSSVARQETPEERAARKARQAASSK